MSRNQEYVEQYAEYAMEQMRRYGIPASVTLAQGICESASGQSELSRKGTIISASRQLPVGFRTEASTSYIPMTVPTRSSVNTLLLATHMSIIPSF